MSIRRQLFHALFSRAPCVWGGGHTRPRVLVAAACLWLGATLASLADGGSAAALKIILAAPAGRGLRVKLYTDRGEPPSFRTFALHNPDRVGLDLLNVQMSPRFISPPAVKKAGIKRILVAPVSGEHPTTRVTFELAVPADRIRYHVRPLPGTGGILIQLSTRTVSDALSRSLGRAPPTAEKRPIAERVPTPPSAGPTAVATAPPGAISRTQPPPPPVPGRAQAHPALTRRSPQAKPVGASSVAAYLAIAMALVIGAAMATAGWRSVFRRRRVQGRRAWLEKALGSPDAMQRLTALRLVSAWPTVDLEAAGDLLIEAAEDPSHRDFIASGSILRQRFPADALAERLRRGRAGERVRAARLLGVHPVEAAAEPLVAAAMSARGIVRAAAVESLARLMSQQPIRKLLQTLLCPEDPLRSLAIEVVEEMGAGGGPGLSRALLDPDECVRCAAIEALVLTGSASSVQAVARLLSDPSDQVRARAARALSVLGTDGGASEALLRALSDPSPEVQNEAGLALAQMGGERLGELALALDRRASEDLSFQASAQLLTALAVKATHPLPAYEDALSGINRRFSHELAQALERNGTLDSWVTQLPLVDGEQRRLTIATLRAAALAGAVDPILRGMELPDTTTREACARLLGETALPVAIGPLQELLDDPEVALRVAAVEALGGMGSPEASESLISALADPSPSVRARAAEGLRNMLRALQAAPPSTSAEEARRRSTGALLHLVHDASAEVREKVARALGLANSDDAVHELVRIALHDTSAEVRTAAVAALGEMGAYDVVPIILLDVVNSDDASLRGRAMQILSHVEGPMVSEPIMGALQDSDKAVRAIAGRGLWGVVTSEQCQSLIQYLNSPDPKVRAAVVGVLGKTQSAEWASAVAATTSDPSPHVRAAVMNALGRMGEAAVPYLHAIMPRLGDPDAYVRSRAVEAAFLVSPRHPEMAKQVLRLAADPDASVRSAVVTCLLNYARNGVQDALLELLADSDHQPWAISALADVEEDLLRRVLTHAQSARPEVAQSVTEALSQVLAGRWTVSDLRPELNSLDTEVRLAGLEGLALVRHEDATEEIIGLLAGDPAPRVRLRAAQVLSSRCDNLSALQALRRAAATDPDPDVSRVAGEATQATPDAVLSQ